jgi:ribonuclease P protein component
MRGDETPPPVGRLTKRPDFVAAAQGRRFHTERMTVQGRVRPGDAGARAGSGDRAAGDSPGEARLRVGFTVTKRVGHAVERNRIRRRLRRAVLDARPPRPDMPVDVVVIARRDALTAEYRVLVEDLERALKVVTRPKNATAAGAAGPGRPRTPDRSRDPSPTGDERRGPSHA